MPKGFNDLPGNTQTIILVVIALAASAAVYWYLDFPLKTQRDSIEIKVKAITAQNERNEAFRAQQTEYLNQIKQLKEQLATLTSIVPNKPYTDHFITLLHQDSLATNTHIRSFVARPKVQKDLYVELPFRLRLDGTYYQLVNFFQKLAQAQRIVTVTGLTLGQPQGGGLGSYKVPKFETVGANCTVTTYYNSPAPTPKSKTPAKRR